MSSHKNKYFFYFIIFFGNQDFLEKNVYSIDHRWALNATPSHDFHLDTFLAFTQTHRHRDLRLLGLERPISMANSHRPF